MPLALSQTIAAWQLQIFRTEGNGIFVYFFSRNNPKIGNTLTKNAVEKVHCKTGHVLSVSTFSVWVNRIVFKLQTLYFVTCKIKRISYE